MAFFVLDAVMPKGWEGKTTHTKPELYEGGNGALQVGTFIGAESDYALTIRIRVDRRSYREQTSVPKAGVSLG